MVIFVGSAGLRFSGASPTRRQGSAGSVVKPFLGKWTCAPIAAVKLGRFRALMDWCHIVAQPVNFFERTKGVTGRAWLAAGLGLLFPD